jgi:hypothetical protein
MLGRQELRMRCVPAGIKAAEGWRRTNRRPLPHPISHRSYCPSVPPSPPQDQPHMALGTHVVAQAFDRLHALPPPPNNPEPTRSAVMIAVALGVRVVAVDLSQAARRGREYG